MVNYPPNEPDALLQRCRAAGLRRTHLLEAVLKVLCATDGPMAAQDLLEHREIAGHCDPATLYRLLSRLEDKGIARRVGLHERAAHFVLHHPGRHRDFVVCVDCGRVEALPVQCPAEHLEAEVARQTGFSDLYHELQYYGHCPRCTDTR